MTNNQWTLVTKNTRTGVILDHYRAATWQMLADLINHHPSRDRVEPMRVEQGMTIDRFLAEAERFVARSTRSDQTVSMFAYGDHTPFFRNDPFHDPHTSPVIGGHRWTEDEARNLLNLYDFHLRGDDQLIADCRHAGTSADLCIQPGARYVGVAFDQGDAARNVINLISGHGVQAAASYLAIADHGEATARAAIESGDVTDMPPWDLPTWTPVTVLGHRYVLAWDEATTQTQFTRIYYPNHPTRTSTANILGQSVYYDPGYGAHTPHEAGLCATAAASPATSPIDPATRQQTIHHVQQLFPSVSHDPQLGM